jgi:hypothetical protein
MDWQGRIALFETSPMDALVFFENCCNPRPVRTNQEEKLVLMGDSMRKKSMLESKKKFNKKRSDENYSASTSCFNRTDAQISLECIHDNSHFVALQANRCLLPAPLPGWSQEQQCALQEALRMIDRGNYVPVSDPDFAWKRMRRAAQCVPGNKSPEECMICARHISSKGIGYFGK